MNKDIKKALVEMTCPIDKTKLQVLLLTTIADLQKGDLVVTDYRGGLAFYKFISYCDSSNLTPFGYITRNIKRLDDSELKALDEEFRRQRLIKDIENHRESLLELLETFKELERSIVEG